jgi:hypothetical protein
MIPVYFAVFSSFCSDLNWNFPSFFVPYSNVFFMNFSRRNHTYTMADAAPIRRETEIQWALAKPMSWMSMFMACKASLRNGLVSVSNCSGSYIVPWKAELHLRETLQHFRIGYFRAFLHDLPGCMI